MLLGPLWVIAYYWTQMADPREAVLTFIEIFSRFGTLDERRRFVRSYRGALVFLLQAKSSRDAQKKFHLLMRLEAVKRSQRLVFP